MTGSALGLRAQPSKRVGVVLQGGAHLAGLGGVREALAAAGLGEIGLLVREGKGDLRVVQAAARELEDAGVQVIVAFAISVAAVAQRSTSHVPIVFVSGSDPVAFGLVDSIARPGRHARKAAAFVRLAMIRLMLRRLA